jgi:flagellin FlaB
MEQRKSLRKDKRAFTGLEAAIVLTAFIVVAAVFSYVVLNAGFFTSSKSKEVVHTGVEQVTSSIELSGDVIGHGWAYAASNASQYYYPNTHDSTNLTVVELYLSLSAGQNPVDLNKMTVAYTDITTHNGNLTFTETSYTWDSDGTFNETSSNVSQGNLSMAGWSYHTLNTPEAVHNNFLEPMEQVRVLITLPVYGVTANKEFHLELKPNVGAALTIPKRAPGQIDQTFSLN